MNENLNFNLSTVPNTQQTVEWEVSSYNSGGTMQFVETRDGVDVSLGSVNIKGAGVFQASILPTMSSIRAIISGPAQIGLRRFCVKRPGLKQENVLVTICPEDKDKYRFGFNGQEKVNEWAGIGNHNTAEFWEYDTRTGRRLNRDPVIVPTESPYVANHNSPIMLQDPLGNSANDFRTYKVQKGETLSGISEKVGVSVSDLANMNGIADVDKIKEGQVLKVNPEVDFSNNPHGGYSNPSNSKATDVSIKNVFAIGGQFPYGRGAENELVSTGKALDAIKDWNKVKELTNKGAMELWKDGQLKPGETFVGSYRAPSLVSYTKKAFQGKENFWTPIHVIGSFNLTMRVNADGYTITIAVYDSKTISSLSDNLFGQDVNSANKSKSGRKPFSTQYIRFIWDVIIPQP